MTTKRLVIRRFSMDDLSGFVDLIRDKMASPMSVYDDQFPTDVETLIDVLRYAAGSEEWHAVALAETGELIGYITANACEESGTRNLGYCIHSAHQGRGYAREAASSVMATWAERGTAAWVAGTAARNEPSVRLLTNLGFRVVSHETASFAKDADGNPIEFEALSFRKDAQGTAI